MFKKVLLFLIIIFIGLVVALPHFDLPTKNTGSQFTDETVKGVIVNMDSQIISNPTGVNQFLTKQNLKVLIENGSDKGKLIDLFYQPNETSYPILAKGDEIVLAKTKDTNGNPSYVLPERYRFDKIVIIVLTFLFLIFLVAGKKGFTSILGLIISLVAIIGFIFPQITTGHDPLKTVVLASFFILLVTTFIAHGISKRTIVAFTSTTLALILTIILSTLAVKFTGLTGYPSDDATDLHYLLGSVNIKGLYLSGIIITTLGALNDITIVQATTIFQLAKKERKNNFTELVNEGFVVGREHVVSLINTLVLAYAGSSISLLLGFFLIPTSRPFWAVISTELVAEEIVKTIAGTAGLVLCVPIVTFLASYVVIKTRK